MGSWEPRHATRKCYHSSIISPFFYSIFLVGKLFSSHPLSKFVRAVWRLEEKVKCFVVKYSRSPHSHNLVISRGWSHEDGSEMYVNEKRWCERACNCHFSFFVSCYRNWWPSPSPSGGIINSPTTTPRAFWSPTPTPCGWYIREYRSSGWKDLIAICQWTTNCFYPVQHIRTCSSLSCRLLWFRHSCCQSSWVLCACHISSRHRKINAGIECLIFLAELFIRIRKSSLLGKNVWGDFNNNN